MGIGIGLIGAGRAGMIHARNLAFRIPGVKVTAISDPDSSTRKSAASELEVYDTFEDYQKLLESSSVDAVVIVTPTQTHKEVTLAAAAAGKHVFCEKPMAMNVEECDAMIESTEKSGVKLQIGFMRRFDPSFCEVKQRIEAAEIGDVVMVRSLTHGPSIPQPWMYDLRASNGPLAEVCSHDIDTVRWMTGSEVVEVFAIGGNFRSSEAREKFPDFYDNVSLVARFANGMQAQISGAQGVRYGYDARCEVLGTKGILFAGSLQARAVVSCTEQGLSIPAIHSWRDLFADAYLAEAEDFVRCIRENRAPRVTGCDGLRAVRVVNAGNKSIRTGLPVAV